ncbi:hypothetical protein IHE30_12370 [Mycetohabitans sp. B46]
MVCSRLFASASRYRQSAQLPYTRIGSLADTPLRRSPVTGERIGRNPPSSYRTRALAARSRLLR